MTRTGGKKCGWIGAFALDPLPGKAVLAIRPPQNSIFGMGWTFAMSAKAGPHPRADPSLGPRGYWPGRGLRRRRPRESVFTSEPGVQECPACRRAGHGFVDCLEGSSAAHKDALGSTGGSWLVSLDRDICSGRIAPNAQKLRTCFCHPFRACAAPWSGACYGVDCWEWFNRRALLKTACCCVMALSIGTGQRCMALSMLPLE